ncbi:MAG: M20/M25/M40 family metallo-hydrolase [Chloroflexi bacterium]|nr:M20/M25/M40 family metallo-hydrolase [Chloroflexota bacterium]
MLDLAWLPDLLSTPGVSGREAPVRAWLETRWAELADEVWTTPSGSLVARRRGTAAGTRPRVMLTAHMDTIGLVVAWVDRGWVGLAPIGGIDTRWLPGQGVWIWPRAGGEPIFGVVRRVPHGEPPDQGNKPPSWDALRVETALPAESLAQRVRPGDPVTWARAARYLGRDLILGPGLDNRVSVAALTLTLEMLATCQHAWDVLVVATSQEETTMTGAATATFALEPDLAVVVDVTFAREPGVQGPTSFPMGRLALGWGANLHPWVFHQLRAWAQALDIPYEVDYLPNMSGTDAMAVQVARAGVPTGLVSIPLRSMHTPVERVHLDDIRRAARLLAAFAQSLDTDALTHVRTAWTEGAAWLHRPDAS